MALALLRSNLRSRLRIVVDGNPSEDVSVLEPALLVMRDGRVVVSRMKGIAVDEP